jgi:hypothetical protein
MGRRALVVLALGALVLALPSLAFWTSAVSGQGGASGGVLPAGETPTAVASGPSVAVAWPQSSIPGLGQIGAIAGGGYVLARYAEGSASSVAPGAACVGLQSGSGEPLTCTEAAVPEGRWEYAVSTRYRNWVGAEGPRSAVVVVDLTPPTTTATLSPPASAAGWNTGDTTVTLAATDNPGGSGVDSITYSAAGAQSIPGTTYAAPFTLTAEGITTVTYGAADLAGNVEAPSSLDVRIDRTPPTGSITAPAAAAVLAGTVTVSSDSADALSGVALARFESTPAGAGAWAAFGTATGPPYRVALDTLPLAEGGHELRVVTEDVAANTATSAPVPVVVNNLTPAGIDIQGANGGVLGRLDAGDTVTHVFSEPMLPSSIIGGWDGSPVGVTVDVRNGTSDRLEIVGANLGRVKLGSRDVVSGAVLFAGTLAQTAPGAFTLTLGACTSSCGRVLSGVGPTGYVWTPSSLATDLAGSQASTASVSQAGAPKQNL